VVDGTTKNTFSLKSGDVEFTATVVNKAVNIEVESNPVIEAISANTALMKVVVETLKSSNRLDATKDNVQLATEFVALRIAVDLQKQLDEVPKTISSSEYEQSLKPIFPSLNYLSIKELDKLSSEQMVKIKTEQDDIKKQYDLLDQLTKCLWS